MKRYNIIRTITVALSLMLTMSLFSQSFPTGGYQGGTHGNIKYTLWTGTADDDWSNPANWCPAVIPDTDEDVVIPSSATVMPEVKSAGMSCKSLTIETGAEVIVKDGFVLTVNGQEVE
jgi:hypothetical protein